MAERVEWKTGVDGWVYSEIVSVHGTVHIAVPRGGWAVYVTSIEGETMTLEPVQIDAAIALFQLARNFCVEAGSLPTEEERRDG